MVDGSGREVSEGRAPTPWRPVPTGAELDPDALLEAAVRAAAEALAGAPEGPVAGVGVASMAETGILLDGRGRPVVPSIAWHDTRGEAEAEEAATALGGRAAFAARTGLPPSTLCSLVKYAWMRRHWPETARGVRWLNVGEWIVRGLGGEELTESSLASRTGFYDRGTRAPWDEGLAWAGAPEGLAPHHAVAGTPGGSVARERLPRAAGAVLAVGGHDHLAAAVGAGAAADDEVLDSCGTAEAWVRVAAPLPPARVADAVASGIGVGWHAVEGRYALLGSVRSGAVLTTVLELLGLEPRSRAGLEAEAVHADPGDLRVSGFHGEALTVAGLRPGASPAALYRAALEALGAAGAEVLAHMGAVAGPRQRLVATGGWAAGEAARLVKERHLGPFEYVATINTGARGAAVAAGRAAGLRPANGSAGEAARDRGGDPEVAARAASAQQDAL